MEIDTYIKSNGYILPHVALLNGGGQKLAEAGMTDIIFCLYGRGRSPAVSQLLVAVGRMAIAFNYGILGFSKLPNRESYTQVINQLFQVTTILDDGDRREINHLGLGLRIDHDFHDPIIAFRALQGNSDHLATATRF